MPNHEKLYTVEMTILGKGKVRITNVVNAPVTRSGETAVVRIFKRDDNGKLSYVDFTDVVEYKAYEQ